jgi:hypothetical protein
MAHYKATNSVTGEQVEFDWANPTPPTEDDVAKISDQQRQSKVAYRQKIQSINDSGSTMDKILTSGPANWAGKAMDTLGLNQPWHPIDAAKQIGSGISQAVTGSGTEANPRTAGAMKAVHGAMGLVGPVATAAGYALNPVGTAAAMTSGNLGSDAARKATEALMPDASPEVKDAISTGVGLVAGGVAGHFSPNPGSLRDVPNPFRRQSVTDTTEPPSDVPPKQIAAPPDIPPPNAPSPPKYADYEDIPPKQIAGPLTQPQAQELPGVPPPKQITGAVTQQPGDVIPAGPAPIRMPPAGSDAMTQPVPPRLPSGPGDNPFDTTDVFVPATPPVRAGVTAQAPTQDVSSGARPNELSPSEVPTASTTEAPQPSVSTSAGPVGQPSPVSTPPPTPQLPAVQPPQAPAPQQATPPAPAPQSIQPKTLPPVQAPVPSQPPPPVQPPQPQIPQPQIPPKPPAPQSNLATQAIQNAAQRKMTDPMQVGRPVQPPMLGAVKPPEPRPSLPIPNTPPPKFIAPKIDTSKTEPEPEIKTSPERQKRIDELQSQIEQSKTDKDDITTKVLQDHLQEEQDTAKIEQTGTPEQKAQVKYKDQIVNRINELEGIEDSRDLTKDETEELGQLYSKYSKAEKMRGSIRGEDVPTPRRSAEERKIFKAGIGPGEAQPKDASVFNSTFRSANQVLKETNIRAAKKIGEMTPRVEDQKHEFEGTYLRKALPLMQDLNTNQLIQVGDVLDGKKGITDPLVLDSAKALREHLDYFYSRYGKGAKRSGGDVGYLTDFLHHTSQMLDSESGIPGLFQDLYNYHMGPFKAGFDLFKEKPITSMETPKITSLKTRITKTTIDLNSESDPAMKTKYQTRIDNLNSQLQDEMKATGTLGQYGIGSPHESMAESRTGDMTKYERNVKLLWPVIVESASKLIYDVPWLQEAKKLVNQIPDEAGNTKELATAYLRNYSNYSSYPGLERGWNNFTGKIMRMTGRTLLGFDGRLMALHLSRTMANVFPEVPAEYMLKGAQKVMSDPMAAYDDMGRRGVLPSNIKPFYFKRPMEKADAISQAMSIFDFIPSGVGWHGLVEQMKDQGMSEADAQVIATDRIKDIEARVTPARAARLFSMDLGPLKPFTQFKQQMFKIAEQYATQPLDALKKGQYDRLARYAVGVGSMIAAAKMFHISTWHLTSNVWKFAAPAYERLGHILALAGQGKISEALGEAGLTMLVGGKSIQGQIKEGEPSFMELDRGLTRRSRSNHNLPTGLPKGAAIPLPR